jgi:VanZ family protein
MSLGREIVHPLRTAARLGLIAALLAITWLALTPQPDAPGLGWDKLNHVAAFLVLAALAEAGWQGRAALPWRLMLVLGYGLGIELVQALLAYRQASALDFAADALGVALWHGLRFAAPQGRPGSKTSG